MKCQFEEKQYEHPLNRELAWKRRIYNPGQVYEHKIAIDAAILSKNREFWALWNNNAKMTWKTGLILRPELWDLVKETLNSDVFPRFKFNLLVQHKRPEHISSPSGREYKYWKQPYFRYNLTEHQQDTLYKLEQRISSYAIIVYACPSFWKFSDLWKFINGKLVENSNFVQPHSLNGHYTYTFIKGGNVGQAFSEPAEIEGINILNEIDGMFRRSVKFDSNVQFVTTLAKEVKIVIRESDKKIRDGFFSFAESIRFPEHELGSSFMTIWIFNLITNTSWGIGYEIKETNSRVKGLIESL